MEASPCRAQSNPGLDPRVRPPLPTALTRPTAAGTAPPLAQRDLEPQRAQSNWLPIKAWLSFVHTPSLQTHAFMRANMVLTPASLAPEQGLGIQQVLTKCMVHYIDASVHLLLLELL